MGLNFLFLVVMAFFIDTTKIVFETLDIITPTHRTFHVWNIACGDVFLEFMFNIMMIILSQIKYLLF